MNIFGNLGISRRLYLVSAVLSAALIGVATLSAVRLEEISRHAEVTGASRVPQLQRAADIELNVTRVSLQLRHAMLARSADEQGAALRDVAAKRALIDETMGAYEKALYTESGRQRFAKLKPTVAAFWQAGEANLKLITDGKKTEAFAFLVDKTIPARNEVLAGVNDIVSYHREGLTADIAGIRSDAATTQKILVSTVILAVVGLGLFSWVIGGQLRRRVALTQSAAERVRDGDLSTALVDRERDEFTPLIAAMGNMQGALTRVVGTVRDRAESVALASSQIAEGNQDLSRRTESQASALEQTAASMEQLDTTVRENADNARRANELSASASSVATEGGAVVSEVVQTMKGINDSSRRIAEIIGTIDGIAFQTNILALNAAVEAARAGEQGRGFAVVASEVRSLAQRSAEAAKEIKDLIGESVERVEQGSNLVDQAGEKMNEIVTAIRRVTDIMGAISTASSEQANGVAQVGQAVAQMDQSTQQNAALVEQSAAAAESLEQQARDLVQAVASFKLSPDAGVGRPGVASLASARPVSAKVAPPTQASRVTASTGAAHARSGMVERRGPNRATNVARPDFEGKRAGGESVSAAPTSMAATGSDDWTSF